MVKVTRETPPIAINYRWLDLHGACIQQKKLFSKEWPEGGSITRDTLVRASEVGLDLEWFVGKILPDSIYSKYQIAVCCLELEFEKKHYPIYADYRALLDPLDEEYRTEQKLLENNCRESREALFLKYDAKRSVIERDYKVKSAPIKAENKTQCNLLALNVLLKLYEN